MKKWYGRIVIASLFMLFMVLLLRYSFMKYPNGATYLTLVPVSLNNKTDPIKWVDPMVAPVQSPNNDSQVVPSDIVVSSLFSMNNFTKQEQQTMQTWNKLKHLLDHTKGLPNAVEAVKEAKGAWNSLVCLLEEQREGYRNESLRLKEKQCPYFLNNMNSTELGSGSYKLRFPCGLTQGSSISVIGVPKGLLGDFRIDLTGEPLAGEPDPPIVLHYNVRLHGDKITQDPVIVQNTWTKDQDWGAEERCPSPTPENAKKVDELEQCNKIVGKNMEGNGMQSHTSRKLSAPKEEQLKNRKYFPFKQGDPFVATIRVGSEGIQMTVDGKHITSFAFRQTLEPWLVSEMRISGDVELISVLASGLPTSEDSEHIADIESLKSTPISSNTPLDLFIGVFSTANNFERRMAVRRTWMQYNAIRSNQTAAVRFFVGLHKNQIVNEELWKESQTYGDIQLMPFVDYYSIISWKTLAICIFGTEIVSARFVMKTDDDSFVRVDQVLDNLYRINVDHGLLYGLINSDSRPHRSADSKWYISREEWSEETYPPWAHGPGYVVSHDIASMVYKKYTQGQLKMFKLEDVAMGIWISEMKKGGLEVRYEKESRVYNVGCKDGYVVAHYQDPRQMLCLWQKLELRQGPKCCANRRRR
ncbi:beta-1,3-galactosyltransferase GALT1 isoform X2 [Arachis duranensis]|uniref:Beta-1,3-galactosyltransferase GALT1 isoform X2 n=1 Tax=Arachis duranensis TaxID=130453 RepID=A0A6P4CUI5_ARADU|nr:beta-1,3-galactosyltransferase GALT1 isoform X2 [Arachis duranensis]